MVMLYLNQTFCKEVARLEKKGGAGQSGQHVSLGAMECTSFAAMRDLHL